MLIVLLFIPRVLADVPNSISSAAGLGGETCGIFTFPPLQQFVYFNVVFLSGAKNLAPQYLQV